jgi:hypothetical protein
MCDVLHLIVLPCPNQVHLDWGFFLPVSIGVSGYDVLIFDFPRSTLPM